MKQPRPGPFLLTAVVCSTSTLVAVSGGAAETSGNVPHAVFDTGADPHEPKLIAPFGMSLVAGGGARGFVDKSARASINTALAWNARFLIGTRRALGVELGYLGSAGNVDALGLDRSADIIGTGVECAIRLHFLSGIWQPYAIAGAGWNHYAIMNQDYNTSSMKNSDDLVSFPMGAGLAFRYASIVIDLRGVYRSTVGADLIPDAGPNLETWAGDLTGGYEF